MSEHRFADILSRLVVTIVLLAGSLVIHLFSIGGMETFIGLFAEDVRLREQDLSLATPAIDSVNETRQQR